MQATKPARARDSGGAAGDGEATPMGFTVAGTTISGDYTHPLKSMQNSGAYAVIGKSAMRVDYFEWGRITIVNGNSTTPCFPTWGSSYIHRCKTTEGANISVDFYGSFAPDPKRGEIDIDGEIYPLHPY